MLTGKRSIVVQASKVLFHGSVATGTLKGLGREDNN
jgi:hypothetical protein